MKKFYSVGAFALATMALFSSCEREVINPNEESNIASIEFTARTTETRTVFGAKEEGSYPVLWTGNENGVEVIFTYKETKDGTTSESFSNKTADLVVGEGGTEATFTGKFSIAENMSGDYYYYAVSPSTVYTGFSVSSGITITVPSSQTPLANSVDEGAQILIAKDGPETTIPKTVDFEFNHATAYAKITLKDLVIPSGVTVNNIAFTAGKDIAGRWRYKEGSMTVNSGVSTITVDPTNVQNSVIWLALAPVDLRGSTFKIAVNTSAGPIQKEISFPASGNAGNFQSGHVSPFTINMNGLTPGEKVQYTLVTDVADLTLDSEVIIAAQNDIYAISTTQNSNNRAQTQITKNGSIIEDPSEDVQIFKIANGLKGGTYAFSYDVNDVKYYIYAASSEKNWLRTTTSLDRNASWKITINSETGVASIVADGNNTRNTLQFNGSDGLFSCYGSASQSPVAIYKKAGTGSGAINPPSALASISITTAPSKTTYTVGDTFVFDGKVTATYADNTTLDVTNDVETDGADVIATAGENKVVTVSYTENGVTKTTSYTVTVNNPPLGTIVTFAGDAFNGQGTSGSGSAISVTKDDITVSCDKGYGTTAHVRMYSGSTLTISAASNKKISRIEFTFSGSYTGGLKTSYDYTEGKESVSWTLSSQARITDIKVTYN